MIPSKNEAAKIARAEALAQQAIWCAEIPAVVALLLCLGWWRLRHEIFVVAGLFDLFAGLIFFIGGFLCLRKCRKLVRNLALAGHYLPSSLGKKQTIGMFMHFGNFPLAAACLGSSYAFLHPVLTIRNESGQPVSNVTVTSILGTAKNLGDLPDGTNFRYEMKDSEEAVLSAGVGSQIFEEPISAYHQLRIEMIIRPNGIAES